MKITYTCNRCGADVTEIVTGVAIDGELHEEACPNCGGAFTVQRVPEE